MACTCPFKAKLDQTFAYLKQHQPADYANLEALSPADWAALVNLTAQAMSEEGGTEPTFKPHPFGSCYLLADLNYAQAVTGCNYISDPKLRADCLEQSRKIYCDALTACGEDV
ncbi:MAG: hypothetical protein ACX94C_11850 [Phycisphaerales bacterium]